MVISIALRDGKNYSEKTETAREIFLATTSIGA
jgi:hypothetical protein